MLVKGSPYVLYITYMTNDYILNQGQSYANYIWHHQYGVSRNYDYRNYENVELIRHDSYKRQA